MLDFLETGLKVYHPLDKFLQASTGQFGPHFLGNRFEFKLLYIFAKLIYSLLRLPILLRTAENLVERFIVRAVTNAVELRS